MRRWVAVLTVLGVLAVPSITGGTAVRSAQPVLAYAFNVGSKDVTIINTATNVRIASKRLGAAVKWLSNEQDFFDGRLVWTYEDLPDGTVDVIAIDLPKVQVARRVRAGKGPAHSVVLTPDRRQAIVNLAGDDKLMAVDTRTGTIVKELSVGKFPCDLDRTADGRFAYFPERDQDTVAMMDLTTFQVVKRVSMGEGTRPHMLRVSPDGRFVWVQNARANTNVILDARTLDQVAVLPVGRAPVTNAFTPDGHLSYISHFADNFISVVDTRTFKEINRIRVAEGLTVIAFRPDGKFAYVAATGVNGVGVIDADRQKLLKLIPAGTQPWGLIVAPTRGK